MLKPGSDEDTYSKPWLGNFPSHLELAEQQKRLTAGLY